MKKIISAILAVVFIISCLQSAASVFAFKGNGEDYWGDDDFVQKNTWIDEWHTDLNDPAPSTSTFYFTTPSIYGYFDDYVKFIDGNGDGKKPSLKQDDIYIDEEYVSVENYYYSKCNGATDDYIVSPAIKLSDTHKVTFSWNVELSGDSKCTVYWYLSEDKPTTDNIEQNSKVVDEFTKSSYRGIEVIVPRGKTCRIILRHTGQSGDLKLNHITGQFDSEEKSYGDKYDGYNLESFEELVGAMKEIKLNFLNRLPEDGSLVYGKEDIDCLTEETSQYTVTLTWFKNGKKCGKGDVFEAGENYTREITVNGKYLWTFANEIAVYDSNNSKTSAMNCSSEQNGTVINIKADFTCGKFVHISKPSVTKIVYGESLVLHANCDFVDGASFKWDISNDNFDYKISEDTLTCKITPKKSGTTEFKITISDEIKDKHKGNIHTATDSIIIESEVTVWQKIVSFFRNLLGTSKVYDE